MTNDGMECADSTRALSPKKENTSLQWSSQKPEMTSAISALRKHLALFGAPTVCNNARVLSLRWRLAAFEADFAGTGRCPGLGCETFSVSSI